MNKKPIHLAFYNIFTLHLFYEGDSKELFRNEKENTHSKLEDYIPCGKCGGGEMKTTQKTLALARTALFAAIVAVLQILSPLISSALPVTISLVMIPIVLGGIYFGPKTGAVLGLIFGLVVTVFTVTGMDKSAFLLFEARPILTIFLCLLKGTLAGWIAALIYKALCGKNRLWAIIVASAAAPVVNTGIFCAFMYLAYNDILVSWADGTNMIVFVLTGLIGINFVIEFLSTVILCPAIASRLKI